MPRMKTPIRIELDDVTRTVLEDVANAQVLPYRDVIGARIIVLVADGKSFSEIGRRFDTPRRIVRKWAQRFQREGLRGLNDACRSGRPPRFSPDRGDTPGEARLRAS